MSYLTPEPDWTLCADGPFFIQGCPCCAGHARERAEMGDLGWWYDTTIPGYTDALTIANRHNQAIVDEDI